MINQSSQKEMKQVISYMKAERDKKGRYIPYGEAIALWLTVADKELVDELDVKKERN